LRYDLWQRTTKLWRQKMGKMYWSEWEM